MVATNPTVIVFVIRVRVAWLDPRPRLGARSRSTALSRRIVRIFLNIAFRQVATPNTR
jgi:hypothetical protein